MVDTVSMKLASRTLWVGRSKQRIKVHLKNIVHRVMVLKSKRGRDPGDVVQVVNDSIVSKLKHDFLCTLRFGQ